MPCILAFVSVVLGSVGSGANVCRIVVYARKPELPVVD